MTTTLFAFFILVAAACWLAGTAALALFVFRLFYDWWRHT